MGRYGDWDGRTTPKIENNVVTEFSFVADNVTDISPVRALAGIEKLWCYGSDWGNGKLSDLSPLKGMPLTMFSCKHTRVRDLSPLQGMELTYLTIQDTQVSDLSPLKGMKLTTLILQTPKFPTCRTYAGCY